MIFRALSFCLIPLSFALVLGCSPDLRQESGQVPTATKKDAKKAADYKPKQRGVVNNPLGNLGSTTTTRPPSGGAASSTPVPKSGKTSSSDPLMLKMAKNRLRYTRHGECRMECRKIDESEVKEVLQNGRINKSRTRSEPGRCPTYAVEGKTHDGQNVRLVFAACERETKLVTAIDLDTDWPCGDC